MDGRFSLVGPAWYFYVLLSEILQFREWVSSEMIGFKYWGIQSDLDFSGCDVLINDDGLLNVQASSSLVRSRKGADGKLDYSHITVRISIP